MMRRLFEAASRKRLFGRHAGSSLDGDQAARRRRSRSRSFEHDRADARERFERAAAFDQDAAARGQRSPPMKAAGAARIRDRASPRRAPRARELGRLRATRRRRR